MKSIKGPNDSGGLSNKAKSKKACRKSLAAIHEAGHAVAIAALGEDVIVVRINTLQEVTSEDLGYRRSSVCIGQTVHRPIVWDHECVSDQKAIFECAVLFSGALAEAAGREALFLRKIMTNGYGDLLGINKLMSRVKGGKRDAIVTHGLKLATEIYRRYQLQISAVAEMLLRQKELSGLQVDEIVRSGHSAGEEEFSPYPWNYDVASQTRVDGFGGEQNA